MGQTLLPVFQGTVTLACVAAFVWLVVMPYQQGGETATAVQEVPGVGDGGIASSVGRSPSAGLDSARTAQTGAFADGRRRASDARRSQSRPLSRPDAQCVRPNARASRAPEPPTKRVDLQKQTQARPVHT